MNKRMIIGLTLMLLGAAWGIIWRIESAMHANYDNFDPGYFLLLPGIITYFSGVNRMSAMMKGWRFLGNFLVFIGGFSLFGLGQSIGTAVYATHNVDIIGIRFSVHQMKCQTSRLLARITASSRPTFAG